MAETRLWTFQDFVDLTLDSFTEMSRDGRNYRMAILAVVTVLDDLLPNRTRWKHYNRRTVLRTTASTTDTCTYDHTGGSSERLLTFASSTVTSDFRFRKVTIGDAHYSIESVVDSSSVTLSPNRNPGADVAAGTSCTIFREAYPLPSNCRKVGAVYDVANEMELLDVTHQEQHRNTIWYNDTPDTPWYYAIANVGEYLDGLSLILSPPPSSARLFDIFYEASPQDVIVEKYATGTITTDGTTTVTGSGTTWSSDHVGQILRVSSSATAPSSIAGNLADPNPAYAQRTIMTVPTTTSLTVDAAIGAQSGVAYTISSPVHINARSMFAATLAMCQAEYASLMNHDRRGELGQIARNKLKLAIENDNVTPYRRHSVAMYDRFRNPTITTDAG